MNLREKQYVAIKALKGYTTNFVRSGHIWELDALQRLKTGPEGTTEHCIRLLAHFTQPGEGDDGDHLCLVTNVLGGNAYRVQNSLPPGERALPLLLAKHILLHTLRGIASMHECGIVHTDLKHDNIMFTADQNDDFSALLARDPSTYNPPEESWNCTIQSALSQPLALPSLAELGTRKFLVSDFGSGWCWSQCRLYHFADYLNSTTHRRPQN